MWCSIAILRLSKQAIWQKVHRAKRSGLTYFTHQGKKYPFKYVDGVGRGGKRLLIWDSSEERLRSVVRLQKV